MFLESWPYTCMHTVNYICHKHHLSGVMILGAGGIMLIGRGYTRAPSYAFQMTLLVEMDVLEKQTQFNLCTLLSVLLITLLGLFFLLNVPRWGWVTEGRKTVVWCEEMDNCRDISMRSCLTAFSSTTSKPWTNATV